MKRSSILKLSNDAKFKLAVHTALLASLASVPAAAQDTQAAGDDKKDATELETLEVTGSRLGRADIEGALPVATIDRAAIEKSGFTSVGELLRNTTFNTLGAFRAQSGSSAQALVAVDLRGLGSERTLVLIDGRRAPKAPFAPSAQDLNAVPLAVVERIEVLRDGASAIYGSDAIGGVINIITRKEYSGAAISYQGQSTDRIGGDSKGGQFVSGISNEKGSLVFGASFFRRDIIFARNALFAERGASFFSNNYTLVQPTDFDNSGEINRADVQPGEFDDFGADGLPCNDGSPLPGGGNCATGGTRAPDAGEGDYYDDVTNNYYIGPIAGGCPNSDPAFYLTSSGLCGYNFNAVAADEAQTGNDGVFARANYKIADNWTLAAQGSVSRARSFGRYAPSLNDLPIRVPDGSVNNPLAGNDILLYHRFAALGTRDNNTDANVYDLSGALEGHLGDFKLNTGVRHNEYQYYELGKNYVVLPIAAQYIIDGTYDIYDPTVNNSAAVLNSMKATINRSSYWKTLEYFAEATTPLFPMAGGSSQMAFGVEYRSERYFDQYDSLSEAGAIGGSSGNSSGTTRTIKSAYTEFFLPVLDMWEISLSGRFEDYNDVGENFAPKISTRVQPLDILTLRASFGQGFRAPTLDVISALPTFSAEPITNDAATCAFAGGTFSNGACDVSAQVNTTIISNPSLKAEESDQYSLGIAVDVTEDFDVSLDYYNIAIQDTIEFLSPTDLINLQNEGKPLPSGLSITRQPPSNRIQAVTAGYGNIGERKTSGVDFGANYRLGLGGLGSLQSHLLTTYILDYSVSTTGASEDVLGDPAWPEYRVTLDNSWTLGGATLAINGNHIAKQDKNVSRTRVVPSYTTWDVQFGYELPFLGGTQLAVGAINVFGREPSPRSATDGRDYNFYLYDQYGTQPYFKFVQKF